MSIGNQLTVESPGSEPLLEVCGLTVDYPGPLRVLRAVSLRMARGETLALVGETGSGKSTLALAVAGLLGTRARFRAARLKFEGTELRATSDWDGVRGRRLGFVFQNPQASLNPVLTVGTQLWHVLRAGGERSRREARRRAARLLEEVGLGESSNLLDSYPFQLSGGMSQRVGIALGIANHPSLLIGDEPTSALDPTVQRHILGLLLRLRDTYGLGVLLISHDLAIVRSAADRVAIMYHGSIVEEGVSREVLESPAHPYTRALINCIPSSAGGGGEAGPLPVIPGTAPRPGETLPGCSFAPRCERVVPACLTVAPTLRDCGPGRRVACVVASGISDGA